VQPYDHFVDPFAMVSAAAALAARFALAQLIFRLVVEELLDRRDLARDPYYSRACRAMPCVTAERQDIVL